VARPGLLNIRSTGPAECGILRMDTKKVSKPSGTRHSLSSVLGEKVR